MLKSLAIFIFIICTMSVSESLSLTMDSSIDLPALLHNKSKEILKYMNESVDPCENFFEFACGNWKTYYPADANRIERGRYGMEFSSFWQKIVQTWQTLGDEIDSQSTRKMSNFYKSCMNFKLSDIGSKEKLKELANEFGQMPALAGDLWQEDDFDWQQMVGQISNKYNRIILIGAIYTYSKGDHLSFDITFKSEELPDSSEVKESYLSTVKGHLMDFLSLDKETAHEIAFELFDFKLKLIEASANSKRHSEITTVQQMHDKYYPDLNINRLMNITFGYIPSDEVINDNPSYPKNLIELLKKTPKKVVANYIALSSIEPFLTILNNLNRVVHRENLCVKYIQTYFEDILSYLFYRSDSVKKQEQYIEEMWPVFKSHFQKVLESSRLNWFDDKSREFALEKLHSMKIRLPSYQYKDFDAEYNDVHINDSDFLENLKTLEAFDVISNRNAINGIQPFVPFMPILYDSLSYMIQFNTIDVTVTQLISDFHASPFYPNAYNFARLGYMLYHEVIHGFTGLGRHYNKLGDPIGDWDKEIEMEFDKRRQCLYDQYTNYTFKGKPLPQDPMQEENAADNAGILLAYQAYREWYKDPARTKEERARETLPNMNYTNMQLFFISFSQTWCSDMYEVNPFDIHSPDQFRTFAPLRNLDGFSKEFQCPKGSFMNPIKKCRIY